MAKKQANTQETKQSNYELMVIIKALLPEDVRANVQKKLVSVINKLNGEVLETDVWGKKHLAYPIQGQDEGYYVVYKCYLPQAKVTEFNSQMRLNNDIVRHLLVKLD